MELLALLVSFCALMLSLFTLYWLHLRKTERFYLVRVDDLSKMIVPQFALVNGGNRDVLVTSVNLGFRFNGGSAAYYPNCRFDTGGAGSMSIKAGQAIHLTASFPEPFTENFIKKGILAERTSQEIYEFELGVDVTWVDAYGKMHSAMAKPSMYGFRLNEDRPISHKPLITETDLYANRS